jgi:hypothetical protein
MNSWITTIFGFLAAIPAALAAAVQAGYLDAATMPQWLKTACGLCFVIGIAGVGIAARDNGKSSEDVGANSAGSKQGKLFSLLLLFGLFVFTLGGTGCARFVSKQIKTEADGSRVESRQSVTTFFDAKSEIGKLRASTTDKTQGLTVGSISEESSGTNAVALVDVAVRAAVGAAVKSVAPVP